MGYSGEYSNVLHLPKKIELLKYFAKSVLDSPHPSPVEVSFLNLAGNKTTSVDKPRGKWDQQILLPVTNWR